MSNETEARQSIIDTCLEMDARGINQGTSGNVSLRYGDGFLITPSGMRYDRMTPDDIVRMDFDGNAEGGQPSSEWRFHLDILKARDDRYAVVHAHAHACTTLAIMGKTIPPLHYMVALFGGNDVRCADYATFGTEALSRHVLTALEGRSACLLAHHGMITTGETLDKALWRAIELETLATQYLACLPFGEPPLLDEKQMAEVHAKFADYGHKG